MQDLDIKAVGIRAKEQREYLKYTREQLSDLSTLSVNYIREIEIGAKCMSIDSLAKISIALRVPTDHILFGKTNDADERLYRTIMSCTGGQREACDSIVTEVIRT